MSDSPSGSELRPSLRSEIKVKATVVVDDIGDSEEELVAYEVHLVPPIAAKKK